MRLDGVEAFVIEHRLDEAAGRRVAVDDGDDVGAEDFAEHRLVVERVAIGLADQVAGNVGIAEPLADAVDDGGFQRVVVQDVLIDEGGEFGLAARDIFRLGAHARPDRIDLVETLGGPCLKLGHGILFSWAPLEPLMIVIYHKYRSRQEGRAKALNSWLMRAG